MCKKSSDFRPGENICYVAVLVSGVRGDHMYKIIYVSNKVQMFTLVELSWFAIKAFVSCIVYFGFWLGVIPCRGMFLVFMDTTT